MRGVSVVNSQFGVIAPNKYQQPSGGTAIILQGSYSQGSRVAPGGTVGPYPVATDISFVNVTVAGCESVGSLSGMPGVNLTHVVLQDFVAEQWNKARPPWVCADISGTEVVGSVEPPLPASCGTGSW